MYLGYKHTHVCVCVCVCVCVMLKCPKLLFITLTVLKVSTCPMAINAIPMLMTS